MTDSINNDEAGASTGTALALGNVASGTVETITGFLQAASPVFDFEDWYSFSISAESEVVFGLTGLSADADLVLRNAGGGVLDLSQLEGVADEGLSARLAAGTYIVEAGQFFGANPPGSTAYSLSISVTALDDPQVAALYNDNGQRWNDGQELGEAVVVTYSFMSALPDYYFSGGVPEAGFSNFVAMTAAQMDAARAALAQWSEIANITFVESVDSDAVQMRFGTVDITGNAGFAFYPGTSDRAGDVFISNNYAVNPYNENPAPGDHGFSTFIHEIGHALGLQHPFDGTTTLPSNEDTQQYTVMSNDAHPFARVFDYDSGSGISTVYDWEPDTPMSLDIQAVQFLYGANTTTRAGDTVYAFVDGERLIRTIYDAGGNDTIDLSATTLAQVVDLAPGGFSSINYDDGSSLPGFVQSSAFFIANPPELGQFNLGIALTTVIENAIGGSAADAIMGNTVANTLAGGSGDDTLSGLAGNDRLLGEVGADMLLGGEGNDTLSGGAGTDTLNGGSGEDWADYVLASGAVVVDINISGAQSVGGGEGTDTLISIEHVTGSSFGDSILGNNGANTLSGGAGNDVLRGRSGNDNLLGGDGDDDLSGQNGNDGVSGGLGNDLIQGGSGDDVLGGGLGSDTVDYRGASAGVTVDLKVATAQAVGGTEGLDTLSGFENINGSGFADDLRGGEDDTTLSGANGADALRGRGGDDVLIGGNDDDDLRGGDGNDTLQGGADHDRLDGGNGSDWVDYSDATSGVHVELRKLGEQVVSASQGRDILVAVENLTGSAFDDILVGDNGDNTLAGGDDGDRLKGFGGADLLLGEAGDDRLNGLNGDDTLVGGLGDDTMRGGAGNDVFVFADGDDADIIKDFTSGEDRLDLSAVSAIVDFADLIANHATDVGADMTIDYGAGDSITLVGVHIADLAAGDVLF